MLVLGILLVLFTLFVAIAIGIKANRSVRNFDETSHEHFLGADQEIRQEMGKMDIPDTDLNG